MKRKPSKSKTKIIRSSKAVTACRSEQFENLKRWLNAGAWVATMDPCGAALSASVMHNYHDVVDLLIRHGANVNVKNPDCQHVLFLAVKNRDLPMVKQLIAAGADVNVADPEGNFSVLEEAASLGDTKICAELIKNGADWLHATLTSSPVVRRLLEIDDGSIWDLILSQENCFTKTCPRGFTLTHWLSCLGDAVSLKRAIKAGALIDAQDCNFGHSALHNAMLGNHAECVEYLLNAGANVSLTNGLGYTPFQMGVGSLSVNATVRYLTTREFSPLDVVSDPSCGKYIGQSLEDVFLKYPEATQALDVSLQPFRSMRSAKTIMDVFSESTAHASVAAQPELQSRPKTMRL